jgi:hypothetical protein
LFEHDLFGKPVPTFPDHTLVVAEDSITECTPVFFTIARRFDLLARFLQGEIRHDGPKADYRGLGHDRAYNRRFKTALGSFDQG